MKPLMEMTLEELIAPEGHACTCGRTHRAGLKYLKIGSGAVRFLPDALQVIGRRKPFVLCDRNTRQAAMPQVENVLAGGNPVYAVSVPAGVRGA